MQIGEARNPIAKDICYINIQIIKIKSGKEEQRNDNTTKQKWQIKNYKRAISHPIGDFIMLCNKHINILNTLIEGQKFVRVNKRAEPNYMPSKKLIFKYKDKSWK